MRQSHLILSNTAIIWVSRVLLLVPQLILVPYLINRIGETGYGAYALVWSLTVSIEQVQRSLQSGVVKYSAAFLAQDRIDQVNKLYSSSFVYSIFLGILAAAGLIVAAMLYYDPSGDVVLSLVIVAAMVLFLFPTTPAIALIESRQHYYIGAIVETLSRYVSLLVIVLWFKFIGASVVTVVVIMAVFLIISRVAQIPIAHRLVPGLQMHARFVDRESFNLITSFGAAIVLASLCLALNTTGVRWLMDALVSTAFVAHLAIILMPAVLLSQIVSAATVTVMPATSAYEATGNDRMLQELLTRGMRYITILALAGIFAAGLLMRGVLNLWVGPAYGFLAPYALVLFISMSFMLSTSTGHHMLKGLGKLRAVVYIYFTSFVAVPLSIILLIFKTSEDPYLAVTAGLAAGHVVCGSIQFVYCLRVVNDELWPAFKSVYLQPLLSAAVVWLAVLALIKASGTSGFAGLLGITVAAVILFIGSCYALIFSDKERQDIRDIIHLAKSKIGFG